MLEIDGVDSLGGGEFRIIPDRIEAGTLAIAAAITGGSVTIAGARTDHLTATLEALTEIGAEVTIDANRITIDGPCAAEASQDRRAFLSGHSDRFAIAVHGVALTGRW